MALNLLSSYGSDDDSEKESDSEEPTSARTAEDEPSSSSSALFSAEASDSNDDSCTESEADSPCKKKEEPSDPVEEPPTKKKMLPSAAEAFSAKKSTGVMVNQYERAVLDHEAMLSRHVPLTDPKKHKPICKAYQRGQCRRGKNCRYDHPPQEAPTPDMKKAVSSAPVHYTNASDVLKARPVLRSYPSY